MLAKLGEGSFGTCCYAKDSRERVGCLKIIEKEVREIKIDYLLIQSAIKEVGVCKLLGLHKIGPELYDIEGFDLIVY